MNELKACAFSIAKQPSPEMLTFPEFHPLSFRGVLKWMELMETNGRLITTMAWNGNGWKRMACESRVKKASPRMIRE